MVTIPEHLLPVLRRDLLAFGPEVVLILGMVTMLVVRMFRGSERLPFGAVAAGIIGLSLVVSWWQWVTDQTLSPSGGGLSQTRYLFAHMLAYDAFTVYLRLFLTAFGLFLVALCVLSKVPDAEDAADFYVLLTGATLGMMLMASAGHLLMVYLAVEMASLPSYALAGFLKLRRDSSEAALKYVVYGGGASGLMLYGISMLAGKCGTGFLPDVAVSVAATLGREQFDAVTIISLLLILAGIGFKLAAVPFHFWCPDVFAGASAEVAGFLSVASKGAAVALLGRVLVAFLGGMRLTEHELPSLYWAKVSWYLGPALVFLSAVTMTFGNLAAYAQTNLKRLLAYSTIAHAGYMMMGLCALTREGVEAALFYLAVYFFMNLGAFAVVAFVRNAVGSEELSGYSGLVYRAPWLTVTMAVFLLSLVGLPPLAGYMAKFQIFAAVYHAWQSQQQTGLLVLLALGLLNTVLSLFYYVNVLKVMILHEPRETPAGRSVSPLALVYTGLCALVLLVGIFFWDPLASGTQKAVSSFHEIQPPARVSPP
ncbi:MAG: NADH-quinone oxidoreductase subunit N [Gemmatales bacterium]|nr:NADH-quinone oxidoreductase subunit N [Gemmatales bacterium]MCS7161344.1 NADH-quinone oxidoreductase subunit N [Gemmatales bacterium]MDW8176547.1 NADH-quinone oxidoreductase subunit N [Gemmatales bacterium]MDW8222706.1 NADH-quinone oxidoreductase subunit N [Gemmatales bacterium]